MDNKFHMDYSDTQVEIIGIEGTPKSIAEWSGYFYGIVTMDGRSDYFDIDIADIKYEERNRASVLAGEIIAHGELMPDGTTDYTYLPGHIPFPAVRGNKVYILAKSGRQVRDYLGFGAHIVKHTNDYTVCAVGDCDAEWLIGRLRSGMNSLAIETFPTMESAETYYQQLHGSR